MKHINDTVIKIDNKETIIPKFVMNACEVFMFYCFAVSRASRMVARGSNDPFAFEP